MQLPAGYLKQFVGLGDTLIGLRCITVVADMKCSSSSLLLLLYISIYHIMDDKLPMIPSFSVNTTSWQCPGGRESSYPSKTLGLKRKNQFYRLDLILHSGSPCICPPTATSQHPCVHVEKDPICKSFSHACRGSAIGFQTMNRQAGCISLHKQCHYVFHDRTRESQLLLRFGDFHPFREPFSSKKGQGQFWMTESEQTAWKIPKAETHN